MSTTTCTSSYPGPAPYSAPRLGDAGTHFAKGAHLLLSWGSDRAHLVFETLVLWQRRIREREQLLGLNERILRDAGLSRADIYREAQKPFWKA